MTNVYFNLNQREEMARNLWYKRSNTTGNSVSVDSSTDGGTTLDETRGNHAVITLLSPRNHPLWDAIWKHVAMIFAVLVMSVANVGMAWADTEVTISPADIAASYYFAADGTAITAITGSGGHDAAYNKGTPKFKLRGTLGKNVITFDFAIESGITITSFKVTGTKGANTNAALDGSSVTFGTALTGLSKTSSMSFTLTCTDGTSSSTNRETTISSFTLTYTTSGGGGGGGATSHNVSAVTSTGTNTYGTVSAAASSVAEGGTTTITAVPASGYRVTNWAVSGADATISPSGASNANSTTLTMGTADATVTVTFGAIPTHSITYTNLKGADNSANPTTYTEGVGVASFANLRHVVGYDFTGWSPSSISSSATTNQTINAQWSARAAATGTGTLTYALAFGSGTITTSSITRNNGALYDATDVSLEHTSFADNANKTGCSGKLTTTSAKSESNYVELTFKIADGYTFTPTEVRVQGIAVSSNKTIEVELKDNAATPNSKSVSGTLTAVSSPTTGGYTVTLDFDASGTVTLEGTVTVKIFAYGATNHWRMGTPFVITGTVAEAASDAYGIYIGKDNDNYTLENLTNTSGTTWSKTITLDAGSYYEFKVKKTPSAGDAVWYGNNGKITATTSPAWDFNTSDGNCKLYTTVAGSYTFSWDASTNKLTVTYPAGDHPTKRIYMACGSGTWCDATPKFFVHSWGVTEYNTQVQQNACGEYYADIIWYNDYFQFTRNNSTATAYDDQTWNYSQDLTYNSSQLLWTFSGWSDSNGTFSSSAYSPDTYTVSAAASTAGYGTVSAESVTGVACGTSISTSSNTLTVGATTVTATQAESTAQYTYAFTNWTWSPAGSTVTSDVTATANFTRTLNSYTVTWKNGSTTLETDASVNYGATPSYDGSTPTKDADALYTYTFSGWSPAIGTVTGNATYSAQFTATPKTVAYGDATIYAYNDSKRVVSGTRKTAMETALAGSDGETGISGSLPLLHSVAGLTSVVLAGQCKSEVKASFPWLGSYIKMKTASTTATITFNVASGYVGTATIYFSGYNKTATLTNGANSDAKTSDSKNPETEGSFTSKNIALVSGANTLTISGNNGYISRIDVALESSCTTPTIAWSTSPTNGNVGGNMTISVTSNYPEGVTITSNNSNATLSGRTVDGSTVSYTLNYAVAGNANITASVDGDGSTVCDETVNLDAVAITISKNTPTKYSFSVDKTTLCGGETATLTLAGSQSGVTYELRSDATHSIADTQKAGTGSALTWTGLGAGTYVVYAVADATYTERQMDGSKITVTAATATSITTQPTNQEVTVGEVATLTVVAAGTSLSYQWKESATEGGTYSNVASGGTGSSYSVTPAAAGTKWYKCVVTGTCGTVTTEARKIVANAAVTYRVTYDAQGGSVTPAYEDVTTATLPTPTKTDYTFQGWYTSGGTLISGTYNPTADITLHALWRSNECAGGGGGSTTLISITPTITNDNKNNGSASASGTPGGTAYWDKMGTSNPYKLNSNEAYFALKLSSGYYQATDVLVINGADKAHYVYYGSHGSGTALSATGAPSSGTINFTLTGLPSSVDEIYVYRSSDSYNGKLSSMSVTRAGGSGTCYYVTYNGNGADGGFTTDEASHPSGSNVTVASNSFTKTGYRFTGWKTEPSGGTSYAAGGTISGISGHMTLYAQWEEDVCTPVDAPTSLTCSAHTSSSLTFTWTKAANASTYTAKLYSDAECTSQVASQDLGDVATVTFSTLSAETTYYCKVQSHGDGSTYCADGGTTAAQSGTTDAACSPHGLAYATGAVEKNVGDAAFTNTLTNPHSLVVTYSSSNTSAATVNATSGMVTIEGAGSATITATWAGDATYCAGTATYTLTVSSGCTPQSLSKVSATKGTSGTVTGYNDEQYAGDAVVKLYDSSPQSASLPGVGSVDGYKMGDAGSSIVFATLKGTSFQAGDKVRIGITKKNDTRTVDASKDILTIYYGTSKSDATALHTITGVTGAGFYEYTLTAADVTAIGSKKGIGLFRESSNGENPFVYSVEIIGCREWAVCTAPDAIAVGSVTGEGATFTITDALNTNNYEIYYSTSSTAPTAETSATISGISTKSRAVTGLTAETTYYYWVRSNCGGVTKSSWVAGTPTTFTTEAAAATNSVTYNGNENTGGSVPTDATAYEEGDVVTVLGNTGSLVKTGQTFLGWSTNATASSGTFYPAGYKFYMPNAAVTLYAVWGSAAEEKYYYGSITITAGALTPGSTGGHKGFFTNDGGVIATSSAISLSSTPGETDYYYESSTLTHTALNKSSNWNTSSTSKRTIRAFKFKSGSSYTLALGSKTATSIMFYGRCGSASRTMTVGSVDYESPSTKEQFFSHEYTKAGNFTGNVTITQDGDFYGILVVTVSTGAGSNHTVTFNMNGKGSAIEPIANVPDGSKIGAPVPSPTAVGAEFGGWYREAGCTNAWNFGSSTISKDTTLYAKWTTCAPSISAHPAAATYTQDAAATALSVTASGEGLNYQWYTSEDGSADIQGSSAIPDATSASYTPSTSLLGTIYYFCVVSNTCGNAVSNKAAITVDDSKPAPTANWDIEEPEEGGKGFTFSIEVNKNNGENWDGELLASMLTLSDNAILDGSSIVVDNTNKTISGKYGVKAGSSSPVTFYLLLPATTSQSATRLDRDRTFTPCAGGAGDSYNVRVRKDYEKDASNNYRWVTPGAGEITYAVSSSISSVKAASTVASVFDSIMSGDKQFVWVKTYEANTKTIRLHVETSGANISVNALYKNTVYATAADKDIVSSDDYSVSYDGSGSAENTGTKGTHYMDITFDSPLDANDIICIKFSSSKVKAYGAVLTTVGDGGNQTTGLTWSNSQASGATVEKQEDAADFTITAVRDATALKSLGLINYTSSNTAIATIDGATGLVHIADNIDFGSDEYKTTTITATLAASGCYKKAVITYILKVTKHVCEDAPGTITYVDRGCSGMDLTLEGYEEGATIKWYKNGTEIPSATSATYNATEPGEYYAVTHKTCDITSTNSVTLEAATATAEKIVDSWYVKNGRRTPDIALVQTTGATSFTVTSGGTITEIGGCTFELKKDGIIYLHGQKEDGSAPSDMTAGDMTITITVSGCSGALSGLDITIHKQAETAKPSVAFVVDGTLRKDGGTATSVSTAKTSDRPLWTYLSSSYALTGCNVYWSVDSKELREYYSQFDAILITDDPNTQTNGTGGVPYVKAFGTMVDVRPILTMEAYVGRYSDGGWHVYNADPSSPNPRQVEMKLECKNHDIFKGLDPETSDNVRVTRDEYDNEYWHVIMVDTTVAPYHNTSKDYKALPALQGFDPHKFDHMLGVGTIADETLQGGVERQEEPAARMMILGIQNEAMAALTNEGKLIIKNAIEYLLKTNLEDVNDCSNYFTGGPSGTGDNWATPENWSSGKVPDFESRVRILRPVVISGDTKAIVARVDIATSGKSKWVDGECNGSVTVNPRGALIVGGKIRRAHAPLFGVDNLEPTENDDLIVKASTTDPHNQGALIFDNTDGDTRAVVEMWNPSYWEVEGGKKKKYWSYVAVPIQEADIPNFFWYGFTYLYDETSGWIKKSDGTSLYPFQGIGASLQTGHMETFYGPLATTESQDITLTKTDAAGKGMNLIGNSWTAPIQIANFEEDDFGEAKAEVWVFNTWHTNDGHSTMEDGSAGTTTAGQWQTIPIGVAGLPGYTGLKVIPAMQAFEVNTTSETTLHLDYDRLVRAGRENLNEPMRAPRRGSAAKQIEATMRVRVSGELTHTDVYLLKDARFSDAFDNGWDGHYLSGDDRSAKLYAVSEEEGALAFLAQPEIDGTALGFAPSRYGNDYTFTFYYLGEEEYYLNDIKLQQSTLISEEESYFFTFEEGDTNRFYISKTPFNAPSVATGTENTGDGLQKARKILYNNHVYIIRAGKVYGIDGTLVAPNMEQK